MQKIDIEMVPADATPPPIQVGEIRIDQAMIAREMQYHPADSADEAQFQAARALVVRELLRQRAGQLGLRVDDESAVEGAIAELLERELELPEPTESDCRRFHAAHQARFSEPTTMCVRHILLAAAPDDVAARDAGHRQGVSLIELLSDAPWRFTELAQRHSACPSRDEGGELGWLVPGQTVEELDRALQHLPEGLHMQPLESRYGWHVVVIDERREGRPLPFESVAGRVRHTLCEQASRRALRHYLLELEARFAVEGIRLDEDVDQVLMQ